MAYKKIDYEIKEALCASVVRHCQTIAFGLKQQFDAEIYQLQTGAKIIENHQTSDEELIKVATSNLKGKTMGILDHDGHLVTGDDLDYEFFQTLTMAKM